MRLKKGYLLGIIIAALVILLGVGYWLKTDGSFKNKKSLVQTSEIYESNTKERPFNSGVFILTNNIKSVRGTYSAFTSVGYDVLSGDFKKYEEKLDYNGVFIFPEDSIASLKDEEINKIKQNIENGQNAIIIGKSKLSESIGIEFTHEKNVNSYIMTGYEKQKIEVKNGMKSYQFNAPKDFKKLAVNSVDDTEVMVSGNVGKGKVIYSASDLAPVDGSGYEYFPFLLDAFVKEFNLKPVYSRANGAIYLDIGYHMGVDTPEQIAERAKAWGYDQINVGVWSSMTDDNINYYKSIIEECHKRGIKVFAWFELPMVSIDFWNEHPEWRQKTADGKDAQIDWRYLMALENKDCFNAVKDYVKNIMMKFDFDGIDIAEIYYESPGYGFMDPTIFTPMNNAFRENFKKRYGFDPKEAFNPQSKYYWKSNKEVKEKLINERVELITSQHKEMLDVVEEIKKTKPDIEVIVTMIDSIADNRMRENIGLDANEIVKLQKEYDFILNIEDPFTLWSLGPERYSVIGENYRSIMDKNNDLYIDINIIDRFGQNYPTKKQRGIEIYSLIHNASKYTDKVIMYSLSTPEKEDMNLAPYAYAYDVDGKKVGDNTYEFEAKNNFIVSLDMNGKEAYIDGKEYPAYTNNKIIIPAGKHKLEIKDSTKDKIKITDINSHIVNSSYEGDSINLTYKSKGRCFINVDKKPTSITLDEKSINPEIKELNGTYTILLPNGEHTINIK